MRRRAEQNPAYREALKELWPAEALARLIIHKRMELELTQEQVAERMGTSATVISRLESGQHQMSLKTLQRIAAALEAKLVVGFTDADAQAAPGETEPAPRELVTV